MNTVMRRATGLRERSSVLDVRGEIDTSTADEFREELFKALKLDDARLIVRLKHVPFMDSSGIAVVLEAVKESRKRKKTLILLEPSQAVTRALGIVDVGTLVKICETVDSCAECMEESLETVRTSVLTPEEAASV